MLPSKVLSPGVVGALGAGLVVKALLIAFRSTPEIAAERRWAWCRRPGPLPGVGPDGALGCVAVDVSSLLSAASPVPGVTS